MKQEELLKCFCGYLPYNIKCIVPRSNCLTGYGHEPKLLTPKNLNFAVKGWKPMLLPLSYLTEEIEHEGGRVRMIERIYNMSGQKIGAAWLKNHNINNLPNFIFHELLKYHFDVYGLIEQGFAIPKN